MFPSFSVESGGLEDYLMMFMLPAANSKRHLVFKQTHLRRIKQSTEKAFRQVKDEDTADINNGMIPEAIKKKTAFPPLGKHFSSLTQFLTSCLDSLNLPAFAFISPHQSRQNSV